MMDNTPASSPIVVGIDGPKTLSGPPFGRSTKRSEEMLPYS